METYEIAGKEYPVIGHARIMDDNNNFTGETIPIVDIPQISDYQWQLDCLNDRLENPEKYAEFEDVEEHIAKLRKWLAEHSEEKEKIAV